MALNIEGNESYCKKFGTMQTNKSNEKSMIVWTAFHVKEEPNAWVIGSGCSNNMINDKRKFISLENWNGGSIKFGSKEVAQIYGKGTITIDGKHKTKKILYVKVLKHNMLNVSWMCSKGYNLTFHDKGYEINKRRH